MRIVIGNHVYASDSPLVTEDGFCRWDKRITATISDTYSSIKRFPTVFIQLTDGDEWPISYYRASILDFVDEASPIHWV